MKTKKDLEKFVRIVNIALEFFPDFTFLEDWRYLVLPSGIKHSYVAALQYNPTGCDPVFWGILIGYDTLYDSLTFLVNTVDPETGDETVLVQLVEWPSEFQNVSFIISLLQGCKKTMTNIAQLSITTA